MMENCPQKNEYVNHGASRKGEGYTKKGLVRLLYLGCAVAENCESPNAKKMEENYQEQARAQFQTESSKKRKNREDEVSELSGIEEAMLMLQQQARGNYAMPTNLVNSLTRESSVEL